MKLTKMEILNIATPRMMRPKHEGGSDWGMPSPILMLQQSTERRLIWWPASTYWSGLGGDQNSPAELQLVFTPGDFRQHSKYEELFSGGRFSRARALTVKDKIDEFFDRDIHITFLNLKYTLVIE